MRRFLIVVTITSLIFSFGMGSATSVLGANEHAGEHPGSSQSEGQDESGHISMRHDFSANEIQSAIIDYIETDQSLKNGYFYIYDTKIDYDWKLQFSKLHPVRIINRDGKTIYFACTNFTVQNDDNQNETLDLDFWMEPENGELEPYKVRIHKVDGEERFTYQNDRPVES